MDIHLPAQFSNRINMLDAAFIDYQSAHKAEQKDEAVARMFVLSCELMNSLDIPGLRVKMEQVTQQADYILIQKWHDGNFDEFLDLENAIMEGIGIDRSARSRIAEYIATVRSNISILPPVPLDVPTIINAMTELRNEVCRLSRVTLAKVHMKDEEATMKVKNKTWHETVVNIAYSTMGVAVTAVNVGAGITGFMSADAATYSSVAGATMLVFRK